MLKWCHVRPVEPQVVREADAAARNRERRDENDLADIDKRHQASKTQRLVGFSQVQVRTAAARQRCAELRVYEPIAQGEHRADHPRIDNVGPVDRGQHERDHEEWADSHHRDDVGRRRGEQAHAPIEVGLGLHARSKASTRRRARSVEETSGLRASASTANRRVPDNAADTVSRSYSLT